MSDGWSGVLPTVVTSAITTVVTLAITGIVRARAARSTARKTPLYLYQSLGWRLRNDSSRKMLGVQYAVVREGWEGSLEVKSPGDLPRKGELFLEQIEPGDTLLIAWKTPGIFSGGPTHTAEIRTRPSEFEYHAREGTLTFGWGFGPH
jgi:hypothetical protein